MNISHLYSLVLETEFQQLPVEYAMVASEVLQALSNAPENSVLHKYEVRMSG